ncbi:hypothetical protein MK805_13020 [Shimazuella sp. AN120528]|uniref:hypothetical protein n=1 Tax=Shimazuella soli TaxID=1892854 RepID=UPI001F116D4E|nr:hypothetical protein [Shimazuella soli]MCH5585864.1 hypothetical protein [Shimazuella soli]
MQHINFAGIVFAMIGSFFIGTLYQAFRERQKANKEYKFALILFVIGLILALVFLWLLYRASH